MANPAPTLNIPVTGSPPQADIGLTSFAGPLLLAIPDDAEFPEGASAYAILGDTESPELEGAWVPAGEWKYPPPPAEPEEREFKQYKNLTVELSLAQLKKFVGQTVRLGYRGMGESGLPYDSDAISLTIN
jgi:hypothetical protein